MWIVGASSAEPRAISPFSSWNRRPSEGVIDSSPPATRSQTSWSCAMSVGVNRRKLAGSTAATLSARFSITTLPRPNVSTAATFLTFLMRLIKDSLSGSWLKIRTSGCSTALFIGPGGSTARSVSTVADSSGVSDPPFPLAVGSPPAVGEPWAAVDGSSVAVGSSLLQAVAAASTMAAARTRRTGDPPTCQGYAALATPGGVPDPG